ncbi:MAG: malonic semialdehyde reductase [Rhodospirillaceae bacterium]|nr:malonic semialdehyde reductase [Rhodospirillaceae bacterium]
MPKLDDESLDLIFRKARTHNGFAPVAIAESLLREVYDLAKWGPTSANSTPARFLFIVSPEAKAKLAPAMSAGNRAKTLAAPVNLIIGYDTKFYELLPELYPREEARGWFEGKPDVETVALRNSALQGAYFMIAARSLGLDCGPMSGFDAALVNKAFWPDGRIKANFMCNIGYGDPARVYPRSPRLPFERACEVL